MNRLFTVAILAILLVGSVPLGLSDTGISVADTSVPNNRGYQASYSWASPYILQG